MNDLKPWDIHPELQEERLVHLAGVMQYVRNDSLLGHEPEKGDTNWGLGCKNHERTCYAISEDVKNHSWLDLIETGLHFVFSIGGVPIRFFRGDAEKPNPRYLNRRDSEIEAHQYAFSFEERLAASQDLIWRLAIEVFATGEVMSVTLVQVSEEGDVSYKWDVPLPGPISPFPVKEEKPIIPAGPALEKPIITLRKEIA